jgi:DNA-binding MarR family transcriptional regulator
VELIDRLVDRNLLCRLRATDDRRQVLIKLTREGEEFLKTLSLYHLEELQSVGPKFVKILQDLVEHVEARISSSKKSRTIYLQKRQKPRKDANHG